MAETEPTIGLGRAGIPDLYERSDRKSQRHLSTALAERSWSGAC
jgi:hypothetical protein